MIFWQLFASYLKIGFFGFGGGYAMLSLIQNEVVVQHAWMTNAEFADIVAVSQITPGPIAINSATYVGYTVGAQAGNEWCGILGAALATFAVCLPSLTLMLLITRFFLRLKQNPLVEGAMKGMRPVVIGMIASAALLLNALKKMAGIDHKLDLIPPSVIEPISAMKTGCLGHRNPRLHSDEVLIALAISGLTNPLAAMVQAQLKNLRGCEAHFSVIISEEDAKLYKRLGINVSCEAKYEVKSLYHK
mgnify:CR=1 FL=1